MFNENYQKKMKEEKKKRKTTTITTCSTIPCLILFFSRLSLSYISPSLLFSIFIINMVSSATTTAPLSTAQISSIISSLLLPPRYDNIPYIEHSLRELKQHGRSQATSANITTYITSTLIRSFVVKPPSQTAKIQALTIIANALVLNSELLESFDPNQFGLVNIVLSDYNNTYDDTSLYLYGRLLFLFTFKGYPLNLKHDCFQIIQPKLIRSLHSTSHQATIELLKFIFNLLHHPSYLTLLHSIELKTEIFSSLLALLEPDNPINKDLLNVLSLFSSSYWNTPIHSIVPATNNRGKNSTSLKRIRKAITITSCWSNATIEESTYPPNSLFIYFDSILSFIYNQNSSIFVDLTPALTCLYNLIRPISSNHYHLLLARLDNETLKNHLVFEASLSPETSNLVYEIYALLLNNDSELLTAMLGISFTNQRLAATRKNSEFSIFEEDYIFSRRHSAATTYTNESGLASLPGLSEREKEEEAEKLFRVFERLNMFTDT